jgi:hypothetical protein
VPFELKKLFAKNKKVLKYFEGLAKCRVGKGISAQASHKTVLEILTSHGFSHSA